MHETSGRALSSWYSLPVCVDAARRYPSRLANASCWFLLRCSDDWCGSITTEMDFPCHVRFTSDSDRTADIAGCLIRANNITRPHERLSCTVRHANASRLAIVAYQALCCGADAFFLSICIRAYTAVGVRFSFRAISRAVIPVSSIDRKSVV